MASTYRALDPVRVIDTIRLLHHRIAERFPGAGIANVCAELLTLATESSARAEAMARRNLPLPGRKEGRSRWNKRLNWH